MPKVIVDNHNKNTAPFLDATGAHAGALLGDVLHDPFQSGGLGTPSHERVIAGMIHKANMGVLFIDEIATLQPGTQQELLTSLQEGKYSITGQSERSAGAMVRTEAVPCRFVLIAAGNAETGDSGGESEPFASNMEVEIAESSAKPEGFDNLSPLEKVEDKNQFGKVAMLIGLIAIFWAGGYAFDRIVRWLDDRPSKPGE